MLNDPANKRPFRRLKAFAVPSIFPFKTPTFVRPSPDDRRRKGAERLQEKLVIASLPKFGPRTLEEAYQAEKDNHLQKVAELESVVAALKKENTLLRSQLLRFENVAKDDKELLFYTGIDRLMWDFLWNFLKPSTISNTEQ